MTDVGIIVRTMTDGRVVWWVSESQIIGGDVESVTHSTGWAQSAQTHMAVLNLFTTSRPMWPDYSI